MYIQIHLTTLYAKAANAKRIAIECQQSVTNISSILCSQRSAMPSSFQAAIRSTRKEAKKRMIHDEKAKVVIDSDTDKSKYENNQDETCVRDRNEDFGEDEANESKEKEGKDDAKAITTALHQLQQPNVMKDVRDSKIVEVHYLDAGVTSPSIAV